MTTKAEWNAAMNEAIREDQKRLGPPDRITPAMMFAYVRGEMTEDEVARVHQFIAAYPEVCAMHTMVYRVEHDRFTRGQFAAISADDGYVCESGTHIEERPATYRRPPMPEVLAKRPVLFCAECCMGLPS